MKIIRSLLSVIAIAIIGFGFFSCGDDDPCQESEIDCGNGLCIDVDGVATCECNEGWSGANCDMKINPGGGGLDTSAQVMVKRKFGGNILNNDGCLLVLGKSQESMRFFEYFYNESTKKFDLKDKAGLLADKTILFAEYSVKDSGKDPESGKTAGVISLKEVPAGTYYMHVFDPSGDKYVSDITIKESETTKHTALVQPLGSIKVLVTLTEAGGNASELNGSSVLLVGFDSDTLRRAQVAKSTDVPDEPLFRGVTDSQINELGQTQESIAFFIDIPVREYYVVGFNEGQFKDRGKQASGDTKGIAKNALLIKQICWSGCD